MKRAFVTGGSGFVGRNLIRALVEQGYQVNAIARSAKSEKVVQDVGAKAIIGDLDNDAALRQGMDGCDVVFHAAAKVEQWGDPVDFYRINVEGTERVLVAARESGIRRFVHVGTEAVLAGRPIRNADETLPYPPKPIGLYAETKAEAEKRVLAANSPTFETVVMCPCLIWGADDTSLLPQFEAAVKNGQFMWFNGGHYLTSTCHIANVCEGLILGAEKGSGGEVYFLF